MGRPFGSRDRLLELMSDGKPRSSRDVAKQLHFTSRSAESVCYRCWKAGPLLRASNPHFTVKPSSQAVPKEIDADDYVLSLRASLSQAFEPMSIKLRMDSANLSDFV